MDVAMITFGNILSSPVDAGVQEGMDMTEILARLQLVPI